MFINGYIVILIIHGINLRNLVTARYRIIVDICYMTYSINSYGRQSTTCTSTAPFIQPVVPPAPPVQLPEPLAQPIVPPVQPIQPAPMPQLNWSHFKPEFAGKPDEDAEAHLLRTNDWMDTHAFPEGVKVQRICLTLAGETRLWYEPFIPIALDWNELQGHLRQQYSKIDNTMEQLLHAWRSFHFDENTETLDAYITYIRQVAELLGYGKPQVLDIFFFKIHSQ